MKREIIGKRALRLIEKVVGQEVRKNNGIRPPICGAFVHQPKRMGGKGKKMVEE